MHGTPSYRKAKREIPNQLLLLKTLPWLSLIKQYTTRWLPELYTTKRLATRKGEDPTDTLLLLFPCTIKPVVFAVDISNTPTFKCLLHQHLAFVKSTVGCVFGLQLFPVMTFIIPKINPNWSVDKNMEDTEHFYAIDPWLNSSNIRYQSSPYCNTSWPTLPCMQ